MTSFNNIGIVVNISLNKLSAHPIFCLQLAHHLARIGAVTLFIPATHQQVDVQALSREVGFPIDFKIEKIRDRFLGRRSLRLFYYLAVIRLWLQRRNLLWSFEPYSIRLANKLGVSSVMEIHSSLPPTRYITHCLKIQESPLFKLFVANSTAHCRLLASRGFLPGKLLGAHNAISESWLLKNDHLVDKRSFWSRLKIHQPIVVTYAGSLYKGRGIELLLEIAPRLPRVAFAILGGPESELREYEKNKKSDNIYFLGQIPHLNVRSYLAASDILVALYNTDCEDIGGNKTIMTASPMKLFEYMACGVPVISSDLGAIPEIIENGVSGLLINPGDAEALFNAIRSLSENKGFSKQIGRAAFERVAGYTWSTRLERTFNVIDAES